jgi:hypothetical protein
MSFRFLPFAAAPFLALLSAACGGGTGGEGGTSPGGGGTGGTADRPPAAADLTRDILSTALDLDITALTGTATITLAASSSQAASFEIGDLTITAVEDDVGPLHYQTTTPSQLDVGVPAGSAKAEITVRYTLMPHTNFDGWNPAEGVTFLWPTFCGNLFPCHSSPADGLTFTINVTSVPAGKQAIFPAIIPADAPSYMPAIAVGAYTKIDLGQTKKGTKIAVWHLPGGAPDAQAGTAHLREAFDFYEQTYGAYTFGDTVGSVSAAWGPGDYGGMEHHPFWHVGEGSMSDEETHAHEAAHGWYGDGVRIACWEDFVLSEGTATYLAARSLGTTGVDLWGSYACDLQYDCDDANGVNTVALPSTCGAIDLLHDPLWSDVPYKKGAFFYKAVADLIGAGAVDQVLATFYSAHVGKAARMADMIAALRSQAGAQGAQVDSLAEQWLRTKACPIDPTPLCH